MLNIILILFLIGFILTIYSILELKYNQITTKIAIVILLVDITLVILSIKGII